MKKMETVKNSDFEALSFEHEVLWLAITEGYTNGDVDPAELKAKWFFENKDCMAIARIFEECTKGGIKLDIASLHEQAKRMGVSQRYINQFISTHAQWYARSYAWRSLIELMRKRWEHHAMTKLLKDKLKELENDMEDRTQEVKQSLETEIGEIFMEGNLSELENRTDIIESVTDRVMDPKQNIVISTQFESMDRLLGGYRPGELWILAGRPSMGKTAVGLSMAYNAARSNTPVGFICLDMARNQFWHRVLALESGVPTAKMESGKPLSQDDKARLLVAADKLKETPLFIDTYPRRTVYDIRAMVRSMHVKYGCKVVFIDYLTRIRHEKKHSSEKEVEGTVEELKAIAKELDVCIVALAQINRGVEGRQDKQPLLGDLRDSGSIEQAADIVGLIYRPEYYRQDLMPDGITLSEGLMQIAWAKTRNAAPGSIYYRYEGEFTRISEYQKTIAHHHFLDED